MPALAQPLTVGQTQSFDGYFTQAKFLRGQPAAEIERRIGYGVGRLDKGWWLLFMLRKPTPAEFEMRGMSYMSDGVIQGHLPNPPDPRFAEQRLADNGYNVIKMKQNQIDTMFTTQGWERLAKVLPAQPGQEYPAGSGIPQWKIKPPHRLPFRVAAWVPPGGVYEGGYV